ncbi:hypothetical protein QQF64_022548 [Cirrhinus molitorella]|uniref:Uncharacterized protein n=1 Tax=Cirrhinus molitorella TaxID=172907 RepID=A0ABR3L2R4_9TELE
MRNRSARARHRGKDGRIIEWDWRRISLHRSIFNLVWPGPAVSAIPAEIRLSQKVQRGPVSAGSHPSVCVCAGTHLAAALSGTINAQMSPNVDGHHTHTLLQSSGPFVNGSYRRPGRHGQPLARSIK